MTTIALFGATGKTGRRVLQRALAVGHEVRALVRGPRLTEQPGTGSYRVGWVGVGTGTQISRDDLADFILTQVEDRTYAGQMPFVSA